MVRPCLAECPCRIFDSMRLMRRSMAAHFFLPNFLYFSAQTGAENNRSNRNSLLYMMSSLFLL